MSSNTDRQSATKSGNAPYVPDAGDIIKTTFSPQAGAEQAGYRRALVLTPRSYNAVSGLCGATPITGTEKGYPFEVVLPEGMTTYGVALADHTKSHSWPVRGAVFVEKAPESLIEDVRAKLAALYGIFPPSF